MLKYHLEPVKKILEFECLDEQGESIEESGVKYDFDRIANDYFMLLTNPYANTYLNLKKHPAEIVKTFNQSYIYAITYREI